MRTQQTTQMPSSSTSAWLRNYYFVRFAFAATWVAVAFFAATSNPALAAVMLVGYPAWDAAMNLVDARRNGGLARNKTQSTNAIVSAIAAIAVGIALLSDMRAVIDVFGVWAFLSGILQLATGVRRWTSQGAQWAMVLSGAQSALAGVIFVALAASRATSGIASIAPYAAFGAFYFLVSSVWLTVGRGRSGPALTAKS